MTDEAMTKGQVSGWKFPNTASCTNLDFVSVLMGMTGEGKTKEILGMLNFTYACTIKMGSFRTCGENYSLTSGQMQSHIRVQMNER